MIDGVGIAAIITAASGGLVAVIAALRVQNKAADTAKAAPALDPEHVLPPVPEKFDGDQVLQFLAEVRKDNVDLRLQLAEGNKKIKSLEESLDDMNVELRMALKVRDAFARWVPVLYQHWGKSTTPPLPDGEDLITLRDFVPRG